MYDKQHECKILEITTNTLKINSSQSKKKKKLIEHIIFLYSTTKMQINKFNKINTFESFARIKFILYNSIFFFFLLSEKKYNTLKCNILLALKSI